MAVSVTNLTKDVWTKVLTNVTYLGLVHIIEKGEEDPTEYLVAYVNTGAAAPAVSFTGGIPFEEGFSPDTPTASDYYVMPNDNDGRVVIYT